MAVRTHTHTWPRTLTQQSRAHTHGNAPSHKPTQRSRALTDGHALSMKVTRADRRSRTLTPGHMCSHTRSCALTHGHARSHNKRYVHNKHTHARKHQTSTGYRIAFHASNHNCLCVRVCGHGWRPTCSRTPRICGNDCYDLKPLNTRKQHMRPNAGTPHISSKVYSATLVACAYYSINSLGLRILFHE
jgi:hypothetical protein